MASFSLSRDGAKVGLALAPGALKTGDTIATIPSKTSTTGLTITSETANAAEITLDDGTTVAIGRAIVFNLAAADDCLLSPKAKHAVKFKYTTTLGESGWTGRPVLVYETE